MLLLALGFAVCAPAPGQGTEEARAVFLDSVGRSEIAAELREYLLNELSVVAEPNAERISRMYSFVMAIHGLDTRLVRQLAAGGIDVVHSMTSNSRRFIEQGLYSDPAVFGKVIGFGDGDEPQDGYSSTVTVKVIETLKGEVHADTIYLRQRNSFADAQVGPRHFLPEVGGSYLLLLSRPMYEFAIARRRLQGESRPPPGTARPDHFAIYRFYEADSTRVVMGDGSAYASRIAFQELRWLQELIDQL
jgi:hypothetical protein